MARAMPIDVVKRVSVELVNGRGPIVREVGQEGVERLEVKVWEEAVSIRSILAGNQFREAVYSWHQIIGVAMSGDILEPPKFEQIPQPPGHSTPPHPNEMR